MAFFGVTIEEIAESIPVSDTDRLDRSTMKGLAFQEVLKRNPHIKTAPIIFKGKLRDFLKGKTVQEMSDGLSLLNPKIMREGIVITLVEEEILPDYGRGKIKQRGPVYLSKESD